MKTIGAYIRTNTNDSFSFDEDNISMLYVRAFQLFSDKIIFTKNTKWCRVKDSRCLSSVSLYSLYRFFQKCLLAFRHCVLWWRWTEVRFGRKRGLQCFFSRLYLSFFSYFTSFALLRKYVLYNVYTIIYTHVFPSVFVFDIFVCLFEFRLS